MNIKGAFWEKKIQKLRELAASHNGKLLSFTYIDSKSKLKFECEKGHQWSTRPSNVQTYNTWCPICCKIKLDEDKMEVLAKSKDLVFISEMYLGCSAKHRWKCIKSNHEFWETPTKVKLSKNACPVCRNKKPKLYNKLIEIAKSKGGECLSDESEYKSLKSNIKFRCNNNHEWQSKAENIIYNGSWCPFCVGSNKFSIEQINEYAKAKGGECLSKKYYKTTVPLVWRCNKGHVWRSLVNNVILKGSWCPICNIIKKGKYNIETVNLFVGLKQGKCLSINYRAIMRFECKRQHIFELKTRTMIEKNQWCPICKKIDSKK